MEDVKILKRSEPVKPPKPTDVIDRNARPRSVQNPNKENSKPKSKGSGMPSAENPNKENSKQNSKGLAKPFVVCGHNTEKPPYGGS